MIEWKLYAVTVVSWEVRAIIESTKIAIMLRSIIHPAFIDL